MTDWAWCFEHPKDAAELIDLLTIERDRYREALERITTEERNAGFWKARDIACKALRGGEAG